MNAGKEDSGRNKREGEGEGVRERERGGGGGGGKKARHSRTECVGGQHTVAYCCVVIME